MRLANALIGLERVISRWFFAIMVAIGLIVIVLFDHLGPQWFWVMFYAELGSVILIVAIAVSARTTGLHIKKRLR